MGFGYLFEQLAGPVLIYFLAQQLAGITGAWLHVRDMAALAGATAVLTLPLFVRMYRKDNEKWGVQEGALSFWQGVRIAACGVVCNAVLTLLVNLLFSLLPVEVSNETQERLFGSAFLSQIAGLCVFVPMAEEYVFRGLLYRRARQCLGSGGGISWLAVLLSAAVFALVHANPLQIAFAFPMGVVLAWACWHFGTVWAAVILHMAVNLSSVLASFLLG